MYGTAELQRPSVEWAGSTYTRALMRTHLSFYLFLCIRVRVLMHIFRELLDKRNHICSSTRCCQITFQVITPFSLLPAVCMRIPVFLLALQHLVFSDLLLSASLMGVKWSPVDVLIWIAFATSEAEHPFKYVVLCKLSVHSFAAGWFVSYWFRGLPLIFWMSIFYCLCGIFSQSGTHILTFLKDPVWDTGTLHFNLVDFLKKSVLSLMICTLSNIIKGFSCICFWKF